MRSDRAMAPVACGFRAISLAALVAGVPSGDAAAQVNGRCVKFCDADRYQRPSRPRTRTYQQRVPTANELRLAHGMRINRQANALYRRRTIAAMRQAIALYRQACRLGMKLSCANVTEAQGWIYNEYGVSAANRKQYRKAVYWLKRAVASSPFSHSRAARLRSLRNAQRALADHNRARRRVPRQQAAKRKIHADRKPRKARTVDIGAAAAVVGDVEMCVKGKCTKLSSGKTIYSNARIKSGPNSRLQIFFRDETVLTVGPNTDAVIDKFVYDPSQPENNKVVAEISKGVFRFISGTVQDKKKRRWVICVCGYTLENCGKPAPPHLMYRRNSKSGRCFGSAVGIRGTDFVLQLSANRRALTIDLLEGALTYTPQGTQSRALSPGTWVVKRISPTQERIERVRAYSGRGDRTLIGQQAHYNRKLPANRPAKKVASTGKSRSFAVLPPMNGESRALYRRAEAIRRSNRYYRHYGRWCRGAGAKQVWMVFGPRKMCINNGCQVVSYRVNADHFSFRTYEKILPSRNRFHFRSADMIQKTGFRHVGAPRRGFGGEFPKSTNSWQRC